MPIILNAIIYIYIYSRPLFRLFISYFGPVDRPTAVNRPNYKFADSSISCTAADMEKPLVANSVKKFIEKLQYFVGREKHLNV